MASSTASTPHRIVILAISEVVGYDLNIPPQIFRSAQLGAETLYDVRICGVNDKPVRVSAGYTATLDHGPEALDDADTVIIPGTRVAGPRWKGTLPEEIERALRRIPTGARLMSICTGAFVLGAAGVLDGRPATTHWAYAEPFRRLYPKVRLNENVLFVDDGDVLTSAGLTAGVDLCLHVLRNDHGSEIANIAARHCVVPPWRDGGQSQFIERPIVEAEEASTTLTRAWALERLERTLTLQELAAHAKMSVRTFTRRFRAETGSSPNQWLTEQRVAHARRLLETTDLPIDQVAERAGLGSATSLRQHLRSSLGVAPLAYRRTFRPPVSQSAPRPASARA